ncbi:RAP domain-containing, putative [Babesia ovis]|uniref:RAP domain-containing, putative n=1 Tax=Babesia ovis TaxID=5869 RepID=A0A9W5WVP9_BABOV|nr:RAP domain-containing, putative [Babesia ovis]
MHLSWVRRSLGLPEVTRLRALLSQGVGGDTKTFGALLQKCHQQLSPPESVRAAAIIAEINRKECGDALNQNKWTELRAMLSAGIRAKLYALTEPGELCSVTIGAFMHGVGSNELMRDFTGRLEPLFPQIRGQTLTQVCDTLVALHRAGYRVVPICCKMFAHIAARGTQSELTPNNYVALVRCMTQTGAGNEALGIRVGQGLKSVLTSGKMTPEEAGDLLVTYSSNMYDSVFIRHRLIEVALKAEDVPMEVLARCMLTGVFPTRNIKQIDELVSINIEALDGATTSRIISGYAALRYKPSEVVGKLLGRMRIVLQELNSLTSVVNLINGLSMLNINDGDIVAYSVNYIKNNEVNVTANELKNISKYILSLFNFGVEETIVYTRVINEVMRLDCSLDSAGHNVLQLAALSLCKLKPELFNNLGVATQQYLLEVASRLSVEPVNIRDSDMQIEVAKTATFVSYTLYKEVNVGPLLVDFVRQVGDDEIASLRKTNTRRPRDRDIREERMLAEKLKHCAVVILADCRQQFYRNSRERTTESQMQLDLLRGLGFTCVTVPYWEWEELTSWADKRVYIENILNQTKQVIL